MPPKKQQNASKKTDQKKKEKIIEDKTFGLKNKKGNKQQRFVKQVNQQVKQAGDPAARKAEQQRADEKKKKEADKKKQAEIDNLFKPVVNQTKVGKGVDPKSVLCAFFKQGLCAKKADRCKFSHDLAIERKAEKRSLYADARDAELENDTMDNWDEDKLKEVVAKKHGDGNKQQMKTDIVCKFFIQAIEEKKYGWFWVCPNGGNTCMYRHALPPGFVLKSDKKKMDDQKVKISIEDLVERERAALGSKVTKVTLETFLAWKKRKKEEKVKAFKAKKDKRHKDFKSGKLLGVSGREMFEFRPDMAGDDDADADDVSYQREDDDEATGVDVQMFIPQEVDASGTQASSTRLQPQLPEGENKAGDTNLQQTDQSAPSTSQTDDVTTNGELPIDDVPVDENLFTEDLDDLDEELEGLDI